MLARAMLPLSAAAGIVSDAMESQCIPFREIPDTTKLFSSFLEDFGSVSKYYAHPPSEADVDAAAREVRLDADVRRTVVEVLREQNRALGTDASTEKSIERLADGAVAIVTGQQVGLFSGPAYTLYKAISAIAAAAELTRRGIDAVPVFWLATEDHDLAEVNHTFWNTRAGLARYELPLREEDAGKRVGQVKLGPAVEELVGAASQTLQGAFSDEMLRALRECYTPDETYGSAFGRLLAKLLAGRGIIFLDPMDRRLHRLAVPVFRKALEKCEALGDALLERSKQLEECGFHAQVKITRETTLLFCVVEERREPIHRKNGKFSAGKASFTREELLAAIENRPEDFSPNALLRPVMEDTLLPTAAYVGGPAEVAYMAQAQVVYQEILGRMPAILPRASFTVVEPPVAHLLGKYELDIRDFFLGRQHLRTKMEAKFLPPGLADQFEKDSESLRALLEGYKRALEKLDSTLLGVVESAQEKMLYQFEKLKGKVSRAENMRTGVLDRHEKILLDSLYPDRGLQERSLCMLPFLAEYGLDFLDELARVSPAPGSAENSRCAQQHHVLVLK
jgi:bacillithiol biosynthesis cysteine-adding enzyme BshC